MVLLAYRAPNSYTREDVIEIQGHGGRACARRILRVVLDAGARLAEPGEFTKRAFLNGRIDLVQAEAVADLIRAHSERSAAAAIEQLEGALSSRVDTAYESLLDVCVRLESTLDFAEHELPETPVQALDAQLNAAQQTLQSLLATWEEGHLLRDGVSVAIVGRPNVGKSTLLNGLLGKPRAIVTAMPGTTRDTIEEQMLLNGVAVRLTDTAGLRDTSCTIEREGIDRAQAVLLRAELVLYVIDASEPWDASDLAALADLTPRRTIVVLNKTDLGLKTAAADIADFTAVPCSLLRKEGLEQLRGVMADRLGAAAGGEPHAVISERHRTLIAGADREVAATRALLQGQTAGAEALAAAHLRSAMDALGEITGRLYTEELLDSVFSRFCVGK